MALHIYKPTGEDIYLYMRKYNMRYRRNLIKVDGSIANYRLSHPLTVMFVG